MRYFESEATPTGGVDVFYKDCELETMAIEELRKVDLLPSSPQPIRIERFIQKRIKIDPDYKALNEGILGVTHFGKNGPQAMEISSELCGDDPVTRRRLNSTLAHEAGHCLLHGHMFALTNLNDANDGSALSRRSFLCRETWNSGGMYNRWEYQANRMIGALLMPKPLVLVSLRSLDIEKASSDNELTQSTAEMLVETFDVNKAVALIRLDQLIGRESRQRGR